MGHNRDVITSIEIENFRGIREGRLDGLAPLTILTGPNGCGKSSVLDALLIGATWLPAGALVRAIERHKRAIDGGRWLFRDRSKQARLELGWNGPAGQTNERKLVWEEYPAPAPEFEQLASRQAPGPYRQISCLGQNGKQLAQVFLAIDNFAIPRVENRPVPPAAPLVALIDSSVPMPLEDKYSEVWRQGRRDYALQSLRDLVDDLQSIDILTEANREPRLYLTKKPGAVPVSLSGDGIQALLQLILELSLIPKEGLALIEEPEAFLHPRAIYRCAKVIFEAVRQGRQIVLTTHSLEFIDAILGYCEAEDDERLALFNLRLTDNVLEAGRWDGKDVRFARNQIEEDLR